MVEFFRSQLAKKVTLYVILISTFFALFSSAIQVYSEYKKEMGVVSSELEQVEKTHLASITSQVWLLENEALLVIVLGLLDLPSIEYVAIYSEDSVILERGSEKSQNMTIKTLPLVHKHNGESKIIGKMVIKATLDNIYQNVVDRALLIILINSIKTLFVSSLILLAFYHIVSRHLNDIATFVQQINLERFEGDFSFNRKNNSADKLDELDVLNTTFFKVLNRLNVTRKELLIREDELKKTIHSIGDTLEKLKKSEQKLKLAASVFTHARESITITDTTGSIIDVNETFTSITGYSREEVLGKNPRFLQSGRQSTEFYTAMWHMLVTEGYWSGEIWNRRKNGEVYAEIKTISVVHDEQGNPSHYVSLGNDITQIKEHQEQLERIAHYDLLTNLPNRVLLSDRISQAMLQCSRNERSVAVVFLDLDGFKAVNDAYGHEMGDELLVLLSSRMKETLREGDSLARIGGDEFVAVLTDLDSIESCEFVLERLLISASEPIIINDIILNVSASIGVTLYPKDDVDADLLMRHADQAMYAAKELGKNRYHFFDTVQDGEVKLQQQSLKAIQSAVENNQFVLYYQPKVNMKTGAVIGVEALIRWQHPKLGLLSPIEFLPFIENNSMMIEIGEWVIDTALSQMKAWQALGLTLPAGISVNIPAVQLQQPNFAHKLMELLEAHPSVEPKYLELEVLETSHLGDVQHISNVMDACIALGVNFAIDDFGTGYSSLTYLRRLPAHLIKIDRTFVRDMLNDPEDLAIVEGVIALAKSFKRDVIAEGVETVEHANVLLQQGCELAQGYGIAKPMPANEIPTWVSAWELEPNWQ
jgi:diguanylate cyclase (GGDEF)-like protein/PAS domain S-box-containing protein